MGDWKVSSIVEVGNSPDAKSFILRPASLSASPFSPASTITLHCSPVLPLPNLFNQNAFCWGDNVEECISYLSKELNKLGLPALFDDSFEENPSSSFSLVSLINGVYGLLHLYRKNATKVDGLEMERLKSFSEQDCLKNSQFKLQEQVAALEQEIATLATKEQQRQKSIRSLNNQLKSQKEEIAKLQSVITSRAAQYLHDLKRKEQELNKLKEKMNHHLTDKKDKRIAIDILNHIGRADGKRPLWRTGKTESRREEEMYKVLATNYDAQIQELVFDNAELMRVLNQMKREISGFLSLDKLCQANSSPSLVEEETSVNESQEATRGHLTDCVQKQWKTLKDHMAKLGVVAMQTTPVVGKNDHVVSITDHDKEIAKLKLELEQSKEIIYAQQCLLEDQLAIQKEDLARGSDLLEEEEWFHKERQLFEEQRKNFEMERQRFTEAAIRLGQERKQFEEERALYLKEQFLKLTPFRDPRTKPKRKPRTSFVASPDQENLSPHLPTQKISMARRSQRASMHIPSPSFKCTKLRRHSLPAAHEMYEALHRVPQQRSFRPAPTEQLKGPSSMRESPSNQRDSATQTRTGLRWIGTGFFLNEHDDSLCCGHLCSPI
ncbi:afadin- and alpha-actinin-binding protein-like [Stegostoma tigrinum]|uniref:afadin- and alpha-actinin-binding protein-like n=1 Tax=Stegostoma tigrinum TaxID=3053191 RepID=UPI0028700994|nr:afadin- and alpha-actinin-binding protein-like [Stegostoma tigrinum]